jgi:hypothetical protein
MMPTTGTVKKRTQETDCLRIISNCSKMLRITAVSDFVHPSCIVVNAKEQEFQKLDLFPSSCEGWETSTMLGQSGRAGRSSD